jgi:tetratricopeptide (TPR) repeat protein
MPRLGYEPEAFREALLERVPELPDGLAQAPFEVPPETVEFARKRVYEAPLGPKRVQALVDSLMKPAPEGLGLVYDWKTTATAARTLELGRGNCVSLASVLVGLGRGLGWPIYYAQARPDELTTRELESFTVLVDHMVVVVLAKTVRMVVDFTGLVDGEYRIRVIDDLTAYAQLINNIAGQRIIESESGLSREDWETALEGFRLATAIDPTLGRAWNNQGLALTRLKRFDEARLAYGRALAIDDAYGSVFGAAGRNLAIMETRALGEPSVIDRTSSNDP